MSAESVRVGLHSPLTAMHRVIVGRDNLGNPDTFLAGLAARPAGATATRGGGWAWLSGEKSSPGSIPGCPQNAWPAKFLSACAENANLRPALRAQAGRAERPSYVGESPAALITSHIELATLQNRGRRMPEKDACPVMVGENPACATTFPSPETGATEPPSGGPRACLSGEELYPPAPVTACAAGASPVSAVMRAAGGDFDGWQPVAARLKGAPKRNARPTVTPARVPTRGPLACNVAGWPGVNLSAWQAVGVRVGCTDALPPGGKPGLDKHSSALIPLQQPSFGGWRQMCTPRRGVNRDLLQHTPQHGAAEHLYPRTWRCNVSKSADHFCGCSTRARRVPGECVECYKPSMCGASETPTGRGTSPCDHLRVQIPPPAPLPQHGATEHPHSWSGWCNVSKSAVYFRADAAPSRWSSHRGHTSAMNGCLVGNFDL